jgi:hypothetical protein
MTDRNDVAIVVIGRRGREGRDLSDPTSQPNYNHFSLTDNTNKVGEMSELDLIEKVHANVPNTLVLFNTTSILDMKQFNDTGIFKDIPGLMYC